MLSFSLIPYCLLPLLLLLSVFPFRFSSHLHISFHALLAFACLLTPGLFLSPLVEGKLDTLHVFLHRFSAVFHASYAYFVYFSPRSDRTVCFVRGLSALFLLLSQCFTAYRLLETNARGVRLNEQFVIVSVMVNGMWMAVEMYMFVFDRKAPSEQIDAMCSRTRRWIDDNGTRLVDNFLCADAAFALFYSLVHFAYPHQILKITIRSEYLLDGVHIMLMRQFGAYMLASALTSLLAVHYTTRNQKTYIMSRIIIQIGIFAVNVLGHWHVAVYSSNHITPFMVSGFYITFLMSIYFRLQRAEGDKVPGETSITSPTLTARKTR